MRVSTYFESPTFIALARPRWDSAPAPCLSRRTGVRSKSRNGELAWLTFGPPAKACSTTAFHKFPTALNPIKLAWPGCPAPKLGSHRAECVSIAIPAIVTHTPPWTIRSGQVFHYQEVGRAVGSSAALLVISAARQNPAHIRTRIIGIFTYRPPSRESRNGSVGCDELGHYAESEIARVLEGDVHVEVGGVEGNILEAVGVVVSAGLSHHGDGVRAITLASVIGDFEQVEIALARGDAKFGQVRLNNAIAVVNGSVWRKVLEADVKPGQIGVPDPVCRNAGRTERQGGEARQVVYCDHRVWVARQTDP